MLGFILENVLKPVESPENKVYLEKRDYKEKYKERHKKHK